jgi:hypothetical protein
MNPRESKGRRAPASVPAEVGRDSAAAGVDHGSADGPVRVAYYYRTRWGAHEEFLELFVRNHWPILRERCASGRLLDVTLETPRFHGDGAAGWDVVITIIYRDWAALEEHSDPSIAERLFPDRARYAAEERRRFELLDAHWDVPLEGHPLPAETGARTGKARR